MIKKPVVLITGAAGGIGSATALKFAEMGFSLSLTVNSSGIEALENKLRERGSDYLLIQGDLSEQDFLSEVMEKTLEKWGRIDVLINNAAWRTLETMRSIHLEDWERTLKVCLTAPAFLSKFAAAAMEAHSRKGVIINISSIMSARAGGNSPAYVACKGGLESLTRELAVLYGPRGIRVLTLSPGQVDTPMSTDYVDQAQQNVSSELAEAMNAHTPLRRGASPAEIANVIYWLSTDEASFINGTTITADGGFSANFSSYGMKKLQLPKEF